MKPSIHAIASFSVTVIFWFFTKSVLAAIACFLSGVIVDLDHFAEFFIHYGAKNFSFKKFYKVCEEMLFAKLYLFLHTAEIALFLWIFYWLTKNIYLLAVSVGFTLHLFLDFWGNPLSLYSYFISRRFLKKFETDKIVKKRRE